MSFDAIVLVNGVARVVESRCKACEMCVASCPKKIIKIVPNPMNIQWHAPAWTREPW